MLDSIVELMVNALRSGNKVLTFGVGGNAAAAIHFAAELAGKYEHFEEPYSCVDLLNISTVTAIAQDFGFEHVFERQIKGLGKPGDVVLAFSISTGGEYLHKAIAQAELSKVWTVLLCGKVTKPFDAPHLLAYEIGNLNTPEIQEKQVVLIHQICAKVKAQLV